MNRTLLLLKLAEKDVTSEEAKRIGRQIGVDWASVDFPVSQLERGMEVEYEHGSQMGDETNVTKDDPKMTAQIARAHLKELPDYYTHLDRMEAETE